MSEPARHRESGRRFAWLAGALAAGAAAGFAYARYASDIRSARARVALGSRIALARCSPIEYATRGSGAPLLVIHGAGGGYDQGLDIAEPLAGRGFRVVAMSRFGYLRTPLPGDASPAAQADAHACLLDELGIARAAVIGASAGAPSAMQLALRHPERCAALVLLVPAVFAPREDGAPALKMPPGTRVLLETALRSDFLFWLAPRISRSLVLRSMLATPPAIVASASDAEQRRAAAMIAHMLPVAWRRLGFLNDAAVTLSLERCDLERIAAPTLVISAADDLFGTYDAGRYTAEHIPGARFVGYPTGGHLLVGRGEEAIAEIAAFLGERSAFERNAAEGRP